MYCNYLYHHGIKGQKWGVRHGPPYPIEDKVLKKGTRLNSVSYYSNSPAYKNRKSWMYLFNPEDKWDSDVYKGPFTLYKMNIGKRYLHEHQFTTVQDLKMPTRKERIDEFVNMYKSNKIVTALELTDMRNSMRKYNMGEKTNKITRELNCWKLETKDDFEKAYIIFNHAMEHVNKYQMTRKYSKIMSQKYDAMVDDNNQGIYNDAHDPIIIFEPTKMLKEFGQARMISVKEMQKHYNAVESVLKKQGRNVKL